MTTWADKVRHEDPVEKVIPNPVPLGWIRLSKDKITGQTIVEQNKNDPYLKKTPIDLDKAMGEAIVKMRARWEMHHYLQGTYYDYDIHDDIDDYDSESDEGLSDTDSDDEQNVHLAGGSRCYDDI